MKSILLVFLPLFGGALSSLLYYDSYKGVPISLEEVERRDMSNTSYYCTTKFKECDPTEGRRLDNSCNNLKNPTRGAPHTPFTRVLPANFYNVTEPRRSITGDMLTPARTIRYSCLTEGRIPSLRFTQLATYFLVFMAADIVSQQDTVNYIIWKPYCCKEEGKSDDQCAPNKIRPNDPVHQFSKIRCMNMTRPISYQSVGCLQNGTRPERISSTTPHFDLSVTYGTNTSTTLLRLGKGGLLKYEIAKGREWPPSTTGKDNVCLLNKGPREKRCHNTPDPNTNTLVGINLFAVWTWRMHNKIARELAVVNPCWNDQRLFEKARDINIAFIVQILYYEMFALLLGENNMRNYGILSRGSGYRDSYNAKILPQITLEFPYVLRWVHTMQEGTMELFDTKGNFNKTIQMVLQTLKTGMLDQDDNMEQITQGAYRQPCAAIDYSVDFDLANIGMGPMQKFLDIATNDLAKGGFMGFQPYVKYREFCFGKKIKTWKDLVGIIDEERIEILQHLYYSVEDVDLLAGIWLENRIKGGNVPETFACLVMDQLKRSIDTDRFWYERPNRPDAFTLRQLYEVRKITVARILCDVGDQVTEIQPSAFVKAGPRNEITSCSKIADIDYTAWLDPACYPDDFDCYKKK